MKRYENLYLPLYDGRYFQTDTALVVDGSMMLLDGDTNELAQEAAMAGMVYYLPLEHAYCFPLYGFDKKILFRLSVVFGGNILNPGSVLLKPSRWAREQKVASRLMVADMAQFLMAYVTKNRPPVPADWSDDNQLDWLSEQLSVTGLTRYVAHIDNNLQESEPAENGQEAQWAKRLSLRTEFYDGSVICLAPTGCYLPPATTIPRPTSEQGVMEQETVWLGSEMFGTA